MDQVALSSRSDCLGRNAFPFLGASCKGFLVSGPIMQCRRVKVCSVGPYNRFHFRVDRDLVEQLWVKKRTIQLASQDWFEINDLLRTVGESYSERVGTNNLDGSNLINRMIHDCFTPKERWAMLCGRFAVDPSRQPVRFDAIQPMPRLTSAGAAVRMFRSQTRRG
jgi:hypothetical protein